MRRSPSRLFRRRSQLAQLASDVREGLVSFAAEIAFWVVLAAGLAARYLLRRQRLSVVLLASAPLVDPTRDSSDTEGEVRVRLTGNP